MAEESVGRVAVEVVPDASGFRQKAQAELERQRIDPKNVGLVPVIDANMAALQARMEQIAKSLGRTTEVKIDIDMSAFQAVQAAIAEVPQNKELRIKADWDPSSEEKIRRTLAQIENAFAQRYELNVTADNVEAVVADLKAQLAAIEKEKVRIAAQIALDEDAEARVLAWRERIQAAMHVNLHVGMETDAVRAQMAELRAETFEWKLQVAIDNASAEAAKTWLQKKFSGIEASIRAVIDRTANEVAHARLKLLERARNVPIVPDVSRAAWAATKATLALLSRDRMVTIYTRVGKGLFNIGSVLSGFTALQENIQQAHKAFLGLFTNLPMVAAGAVAVFALAGAFLSTAAAVASFAGQLASALPVLLALPGIAIGIGVMVAAFKDFGTVLPGVQAQLKTLQPLISKAFWDEAKTGVADLAANIMGPLKTGLSETATAIGSFIGTFASQLGTALAGDGGLASWFANLQASVVAFAPAITSIVNIFMQFGQVGSAMLVPLANMVADLAARFDLWFNGLVGGAGGIQAFADQTVAALQGIIEFVIQLGAIFGATFRAAQDSGTMTFTSLAQSMNDWADGGGLGRLQVALTSLFQSAHQMWDNFGAAASDSLGGAMENLTKLLSAVLPVIGTIMGTMTKLLAGAITPEATAGIQAFIDGVAKGVSALGPAFALLGPLIGTLGPVLGQLATTIGQVFGALSPSIGALLPAITPIIQILGGGLVTVVKALSPMIEQLGKILADALTSPAFKSALEAVVNIIAALVPVLQPIIDLVGRLIPVLMPVITAILTPIAGLIGQLVPLLNPIVDVIMGIVSAITPLIPILMNLLMSIIEPLMPLITALVSAILPLLVPIIQVIATVLQLLMAIITPILEAVLPLLIGLLTIVVDVIGLVVSALAVGLQGALQWIQDGITKVSESISAFLQKWQELWNTVLEWFQGIWTKMLNWIKDLLGIHSPSRWFLDLAQNMLQGMLDGLKAGWEWIVSFFTAAWQWLKDMWTAAFDAVVAIIKFYWDFAVSLFTGAWELLKAIVVGGWDAIKGFFSTATAAMKTIVSDAWNGVISFFTGGIGNAVRMVAELPGKVMSALGNLGSTLYSAGRDLVQGLLNGIGSLASTIGNWFLNKIPAWIRDPFKAALGIHSPSTVFAGFGENIIDGLVNGMESAHHKVFRSMDGLAAGMADTQFALPTVNSGGLAAVAAQVAAAMGGGASRTLNYYAAPGSGLSSEEELFAAAGRGRMVW